MCKTKIDNITKFCSIHLVGFSSFAIGEHFLIQKTVFITWSQKQIFLYCMQNKADFCTSFAWLVDYQICLVFWWRLKVWRSKILALTFEHVFYLPCDLSKLSNPYLISSIGLGMFCTLQTVYLCLSPAIFQIMDRSAILLWNTRSFL